MSECTVVLPTFDRRHVLERTIHAYLPWRDRMLVVDDGSHDGTADWLLGLGFEVVRHPRRRGLPAARNTGLRLARTRFVLFGEDDVIFAPGHLELLLDAAARYQRGAVFAGALYAWDRFELPVERPAASRGPLLDGTLLLGDFASVDPGSAPIPLPSVHACALVERSAAIAVGGYDESLVGSAFREESDLYGRIWSSGRGVLLVPPAWAIHVRHRLGGGCRGRSGLIAKAANRWTYWRNNARYMARHAACWRRWAGPPAVSSRGAFAWRLALQTFRSWRR